MGDDQIGAKNTESDGPTSQGERTPRLRMWVPNSSRFPKASLFSPFVWEISDIIYPSPWFILFLHLLVTQAHTWVYVPSATLSGTLWAANSPQRTVQESCPHKWDQGVSCGYLIRRWQLLLGWLFYHAPIAGPLGLELLLGCSRGLPLETWRFPLLWFWSAEDKIVLGSISWQSGFPLFVLGHFFHLGMGLELDMK